MGHSLGGASLLIYIVMQRLKKKPHYIHRLILFTPAGFLKTSPIPWVCTLPSNHDKRPPTTTTHTRARHAGAAAVLQSYHFDRPAVRTAFICPTRKTVYPATLRAGIYMNYPFKWPWVTARTLAVATSQAIITVKCVNGAPLLHLTLHATVAPRARAVKPAGIGV